MPTPAPTLHKTDPTHWRIVGMVCRCGGGLVICRCGIGEFLYETYCDHCQKCDPNGWPTLKACLENAERYFAMKQENT